MNYNIKGTGVSISDEIRSYVEKRLSHVDQLLRTDTTAHVDIELHKAIHEEQDKYRAEFTLQSGAHVYRAEALGESLHAAIDVSSSDLTQEVTRAKKKSLHLLRRSAAKVKAFIRGFTK